MVKFKLDIEYTGYEPEAYILDVLSTDGRTQDECDTLSMEYHLDKAFYEMLAHAYHKTYGLDSSVYFTLGFNYAHAKARLVARNEANNEEIHIYNLQNGKVIMVSDGNENYQLDRYQECSTEECISILSKGENLVINTLAA